MMTKHKENFSKEEIKELKEWGSKNILSILKYFNIKTYEKGWYLQSSCPIPSHGGDGNNRTAFSWSLERNTWKCYTHRCHEDTSSDIIGFIMAMNEMAFPQALRFLGDLKNNNEFTNIQAVTKEVDIKVEERKQSTKIPHEKLDILYKDTYFAGRGISKEVLNKHKVGYWQKTDTHMDKRAIVPVFDIDNNLVGFSGRKVDDNADGSKWVHGLDFVIDDAGRFIKSNILYNINNAKDSIKTTKRVYIVEGPIDTWRLEMAGIFNVVATLGLGISLEQQKQLIGLGVQEVIVCYDNDENKAGEIAANNIKKNLSDIFKVLIKIPKTKKDYGDMSVAEVLENLLND